MNVLRFWEKIPIFFRWLLLFPIVLIISVTIGIIIRITVLAGGFPLPIFNLVFPPIMAVIDLFIVYHLAPSIKFKLLIVLISLRSLLIPLFIFGFYMHYQGADMEISWNEWWAPFIGEILALIASLWLYKYLKEEFA